MYLYKHPITSSELISKINTHRHTSTHINTQIRMTYIHPACISCTLVPTHINKQTSKNTHTYTYVHLACISRKLVHTHINKRAKIHIHTLHASPAHHTQKQTHIHTHTNTYIHLACTIAFPTLSTHTHTHIYIHTQINE